MAIERPKTGWARVMGMTGRVSEFVPVADMEVSEKSIFIQGATKGVAAVEFSWVSLSHIEYVTDEEMQAIKKAQEAKPGGRS